MPNACCRLMLGFSAFGANLRSVPTRYFSSLLFWRSGFVGWC